MTGHTVRNFWPEFRRIWSREMLKIKLFMIFRHLLEANFVTKYIQICPWYLQIGPRIPQKLGASGPAAFGENGFWKMYFFFFYCRPSHSVYANFAPSPANALTCQD